MTLKDKLLKLNLVEDNKYLDLYCELIEKNKETKREKFKTQKHHVIPRYYFKENNLKIDNSKENCINLSHIDHILAHLYLLKCSNNIAYINANLYSLSFVIRGLKFNSNFEVDIAAMDIDGIIDSVGESYQKLKETLYKNLSEKNKNLKNTQGKIWIKRCNEHKLIHPNELSIYENQGWIRGKLSYGEESRKLISKKLKEYYSKETNRRRFKDMAKNRVWIKKGCVTKTINKADVATYIKEGWTLGRLKLSEEKRKKLSQSHKGLPSNVKGRKKINNGKEMKTVKVAELDSYLNSGWKLGELPKSKEWLQKIAKSNTKCKGEDK